MSKAFLEKSSFAKKSAGFTLIEVMVVVAILGILAAIVMTNVVGKDEQARITAAKAGIAQVSNALEMYKLDNHRYPTTDEGLDALINRPASAKTFPAGGYLKVVFRRIHGVILSNILPPAVVIMPTIFIHSALTV